MPVETRTRVVGGDVDRCNFEEPDGRGRGGTAGVADAVFPKFFIVEDESVPMEV